ncbi:D-Ala-D-Ala carboxypeptidase family metallohydrolase [Microbacterium sp. G2-8]|uniref:D-Ala-D-Ala carboxypeptidase family metallohydrolase n=1 Tax=Microbacterium sp. G2-8 TaxID=2842454 RepID=UPI001C8A2A08|nr:D-Ala-D-Ala carboxypeptidase family metallohydrolase [Microbacterium sp. G2-8]
MRELQIRVAGWTARDEVITIDRQFGPATYRALRRFQSAYGLTADGVAGSRTFAALDALTSSNGSTKNFTWREFYSPDVRDFTGSDVASRAQVKANVRHLMYKLEALRRKLGNQPVRINSAFRSTAINRSVGGVGDSQHLYGRAADISVTNRSVSTVIEKARTCGFPGIIRYSGHTHVDTGFWFRQLSAQEASRQQGQSAVAHC